jgi:hypothetical protein
MKSRPSSTPTTMPAMVPPLGPWEELDASLARAAKVLLAPLPLAVLVTVRSALVSVGVGVPGETGR